MALPICSREDCIFCLSIENVTNNVTLPDESGDGFFGNIFHTTTVIYNSGGGFAPHVEINTRYHNESQCLVMQLAPGECRVISRGNTRPNKNERI